MYSFCSCFESPWKMPLRLASSIHSTSMDSKAPLRTILLMRFITAMAVRSSSCFTTGPVCATKRKRQRSSASFIVRRYASSNCFRFTKSITRVHVYLFTVGFCPSIAPSAIRSWVPPRFGGRTIEGSPYLGSTATTCSTQNRVITHLSYWDLGCQSHCYCRQRVNPSLVAAGY
ncbi:hypothetical protein FGO68_gene7590 [Halteria grandinella]|uniref:Uncharacterized protein n=1 Tax=Halteria grandinella TaxID=5974 RepID=A0A8J8NDF2_HALGN|nr:hypothetical protein FGO68_gene7590 [Halteria grandinella]